MIQRTSYIEKLLSLKDQRIIKAITGMRRCGKSTIMAQYHDALVRLEVAEQQIVNINLECRENEKYQSWTVLYDEIVSHCGQGEKTYVLLDEVQQIEDFERLIDALFVREDIDLYVTGSNAFLLSSELATLLSGRYIEIHVLPYSFAEYCQAFPDEHNLDRLFRQFLNVSALPEAVNLSLSAPSMVNDYLKSIHETVVVKDIMKRHNLRKRENMERILSFVYDNVGNITSPNNIAEVIKASGGISHNTVSAYLSYLAQSYIIYPASRYDMKGKSLLTTNPKYYVVDLGLKNILQSNRFDADLGHKLENIVFLELLRRGGEVRIGKMDDKEVDFVVEKGNGEREYYQVAYSVNDEKTLKREISSLSKLRDVYPKYLLTLDWDTSIISGIRKINIVDWLLAPTHNS